MEKVNHPFFLFISLGTAPGSRQPSGYVLGRLHYYNKINKLN